MNQEMDFSLKINSMELIVQDIYEKMECKIYLKEIRDKRIVIIGFNGTNLIEQTLPDNQSIDVTPLLVIPMFFKDTIIKAFVNFASSKNIKTENENLLKGKLEATEFHLKDMRDISLKLLSKIK